MSAEHRSKFAAHHRQCLSLVKNSRVGRKTPYKQTNFTSNVLHVLIYSVFSTTSKFPITEAFHGIKWAHDIIGYPSPTDNTEINRIYFRYKNSIYSSIYMNTLLV